MLVASPKYGSAARGQQPPLSGYNVGQLTTIVSSHSVDGGKLVCTVHACGVSLRECALLSPLAAVFACTTCVQISFEANRIVLRTPLLQVPPPALFKYRETGSPCLVRIFIFKIYTSYLVSHSRSPSAHHTMSG